MAGDWLKMEKATARKPEMLAISDSLGIHPDHAIGLCFRFWSWCDDHLSNSNAKSVTKITLDAIVGRDGFAEALQTGRFGASLAVCAGHFQAKGREPFSVPLNERGEVARRRRRGSFHASTVASAVPDRKPRIRSNALHS